MEGVFLLSRLLAKIDGYVDSHGETCSGFIDEAARGYAQKHMHKYPVECASLFCHLPLATC